jgi:small subunit ribosomal protein S6
MKSTEREKETIVTPYETLFILHPDLGGRAKEFIDRFKAIIDGQGGTVSQVEEWGLRDLAYRIQKQAKGYYVLLQYRATGRAVDELERNMKLMDGLLRYLSVRLDETGEPALPPKQVEASKKTEESVAKSNA